MIEWLLPLISLIALLALSAFFSGAETTLFSLGKIHLRRLMDQSPRVGAVISDLLGMPSRLLSTILLGNTIANTFVAALTFWLLARHFTLPVAMPATIILVVGMIVTVGELLPKLIAVLNPDRMARIVAIPLGLFTRMMGPLLTVLQKISEGFIRLFTLAGPKQTTALSDDEVGTLLEVGLQEGVLRETEKNMIQEILRLRQRVAKDLLTPRVDMVSVSATMSKPELITFLKACKHRRVPVYDESPDTIVGILDVRRFLLTPEEDVVEIMDPPSFVPETMSAVRLLKSFQTRKRPMAVVVDEFGGTEGLITMSDILEEIVGDLASEFRQPEQEIKSIAPNAWMVRGETRLEDLNEQLGLNLECPGVETVSGLVSTRSGGIPRPNAQIRLENLQFTVQRVAKRRIVELRLERLEEGK